jgi:GDPmannose 4,6-dehydratase
MARKKALITGISGQDGSYLTEHLLRIGYEVHGIVRRNSVPEHQESRIDYLRKDIDLYYGDVTDVLPLQKIIEKVAPDEIYNLAAQSHVRISFDLPEFTTAINAIGPLRILEILRYTGIPAKFYQASSSEMFGSSVDSDNFQRETTPMHPVSPYGCAKLYAYSIVKHYRIAHNIFASNGILFNHESPRRGSNFVTSKIIKTAVQIKLGMENNLVLGNLDSFRDWGHSRDYVKAMHLILQNDLPGDWVVSTGETRSVRELVELVFTKLDLDYTNHVSSDPKFMRAEELPYLRGDSKKIRSELGWAPETSFDLMIDEMIDHWMSVLSNKSKLKNGEV